MRTIEEREGGPASCQASRTALPFMFDRLKAAKRLDEHSEALASVQRRLTALEVQWTDTLDRLKQMMGRVLKERQRAERMAGEDEPLAGMHDTINRESPVPGTTLTSRMQEMNDRILARRNRLRQEQ